MDEVVGDAVTIVLSQRADGQWATVVCPESAHESLVADRITEPMRQKMPFLAQSGLRISSRSRSWFRIQMASGNRNGASSTAMKASDGRLPLAFALLVIAAVPALADFRVCNKTHALINIAVGTDAGEAFKTEGWWVATPGSCATPVRGPLKSRFVYLYATDIDGVDLVVGTATMCIDRGKFVAYGADNCWRRGLQAVTFAEIDTLDSTDWTTFLTDPRK
jgi:uncharacterized membrane protein